MGDAGPVEARGPLVGWVCGYGSLARLTAPLLVGGRAVAPVWGRLLDHRRDWGVAMDNRAAVSDPKHYVRRSDGARHDGFVAFLDVVPVVGGALGALAVPVDADRLAALDAREVNYDRHDVTARFSPLDGTRPGPVVWAYRGTAEGRERARLARADGLLAVSTDYVREVEAAFRAQPPGLPSFRATTTRPDCPAARLDLVARSDLLGY